MAEEPVLERYALAASARCVALADRATALLLLIVGEAVRPAFTFAEPARNTGMIRTAIFCARSGSDRAAKTLQRENVGKSLSSRWGSWGTVKRLSGNC